VARRDGAGVEQRVDRLGIDPVVVEQARERFRRERLGRLVADVRAGEAKRPQSRRAALELAARLELLERQAPPRQRVPDRRYPDR
jgi:hypothetical protein